MKIKMVGEIRPSTIVCVYRNHTIFLASKIYEDKDCENEIPYSFGTVGYINEWHWSGNRVKLTSILNNISTRSDYAAIPTSQ